MNGIGIGLPLKTPYSQSLNPMFLDWLEQYEINTGLPFPQDFKGIYNNLYKDLEGTGTEGTFNCFPAYRVVMGSPGYYAGSGNTWPLRSDYVTPTRPPMSEINGGGNYVNIGANPNIYSRQAVGLKAWNTGINAATLPFIASGSAGYGSWLLTAIPSNSLYLIGCSDGVSEISLQPNFNGTQSAAAVHESTYFVATHGGSKGYFEVQRTAASGTNCEAMYKNAVLIGNGSVTSTGVPSKDIICCGFSDDNGATISQTVSGGQTPFDGLITVIDMTQWTPAIGLQFYNSFKKFYTSMSIAA